MKSFDTFLTKLTSLGIIPHPRTKSMLMYLHPVKSLTVWFGLMRLTSRFSVPKVDILPIYFYLKIRYVIT